MEIRFQLGFKQTGASVIPTGIGVSQSRLSGSGNSFNPARKPTFCVDAAGNTGSPGFGTQGTCP